MAEDMTATGIAKNVFSKIGMQMLSPTKPFINWDIATALAWDFAGGSDRRLFSEEEQRKEYAQLYKDIITRIRPMISDYVGQPWQGEIDPIYVFDRIEWIVVTVENLKSIFSHLSQDYWEALDSYLSLSYPLGQKIIRKASEISITSEFGFLVGYLSRKVLAQYDFGFPKADGLLPGELFYFVEANILEFEQRYELDSLAVRLWIALHEATHSFQFKASPWLGDYISELLGSYLELIDDTIRTFKDESDEGKFVFSLSSGWWKNIIGLEHKELIRKIQSLMCLVEGYSEHVMMQVGKRFPNYDVMAGFFKERQKRKSIAELMLEKIIGFDLKVKQYSIGEKFAAYVAEEEGIVFLNKAWESKENLPNWDEIYMPGLWIKRIKALC